ncbi:MAG: helicase-related protein [Sphingomonas sp.]|jgi:ATP-dependent RNA helicase SUPV3L1/SUV3|uniref:helicase-related protein n=1 Tax=Sphingomonas sp. TaxID=28214 RepID=UPI0035652B22
MRRDSERPVTAVLGPTNTGKTHLAVERLCGHSSGMIGFPLRLLAREVYDRVVKIKGANQVALITGEEKIVPKDARWFLCTVESMPVDRDLAFVGIDEAQLGADPERGHVFTDRILRARGREETMILGSEALRPMLKALVPGIDILNRPRFSTLSYAGARKISRLPKRSAIVAFSAEEVYAVAEMLRRLRGGAAVVMGALSPRTRNAQVAMFQAGEVDYLVATDAIGMGLNMDVAHVAFASLDKFDGHRQRRLTVAEMAQIAGRAGRHQRDGTFGALVEEGPGAFTPEEVLAIEEHRFPRLDFLYWRDGDPDMASVDVLIASLETRPTERVLRAAPQSTDLAILKRLVEEGWVRDRVRSPAMVKRLWAAAGLPDFRKLGVDPHARFAGRVFGHLSEGTGHIPHTWFAEEIARLDNVAGDVETLAGRIAAARSWAYIANRPDWLADPTHWAARAAAVEERLSDALHLSLTQRFVDKRTTMLLRQIGADKAALPVTIGPEGEVMVEEHAIGRLDGFRFSVAADARHGDKRLLLAAAERRLGDERARRGETLARAEDAALAIDDSARPAILWEGLKVADLAPGPSLARPRVKLDRSLDCLERGLQARARSRLEEWLAGQIARRLPGLVALDAAQRDPAATPPLRAVAAALVGAGGIVARGGIDAAVDALDAGARKRLRVIGVTIGALDLFDQRLLKPGPARWRRMLIAAQAESAPGAAPPDGASVLARGAQGATLADGYRPLGNQAVRVDLAERIARAAHDARAGRKPFAPDPALATSIGVTPETLARLMAALGFRTAPAQEGAPRWVWRGLTRARVAPPPRDNAFAALAGLRSTHG